MKSVMTALVLITLMLVGIIKEEIKIVFIIIRYQDFLVEYKVGDFCTREHSGIVSVWKLIFIWQVPASVEPIVIISFHEDKSEDAKEENKVVQKVIEPQPEPPPIKRWFYPLLNKYLTGGVLRYYGRKKAEESESEISVDSESSEEETRFVASSSN